MGKIKISIVGARGYTGQELIKILLNHPKVDIVSLFASQKLKEEIPVCQEFPAFKNLTELNFEPFAVEKIADDTDVAFLNVPHTVSMKYAKSFLDKGIKVIDLSADFRIKDVAKYNQWYKTEHSCPELIADAVYGLSEINKKLIKNCKLLANPGCYPTGTLLASAPLLKNKLVEAEGIIVDSKSGVSGAGRKESLAFSYVECNENMKAYRISDHQHTPEIEQEMSVFAGENIKISFTPHLIPINRGILNTLYFKIAKQMTTEGLISLYSEFYKDSFFVRILETGQYPEIKNVVNQNFCDIGLKVDERTNRVVVVSAIDNLVKGASGQAVQNMNLMFGFDEKEGLL